MGLLESAGAAKAEVMINAIDRSANQFATGELVAFRICRLRQRARDVDHYIRLRPGWWR